MTMQPRVRRAVEVRGVVQGVGFRPFVARLAERHGLAGQVGNDEVSVFIEVEGSVAAVDCFVADLPTEAPAMAVVLDVTTRELPATGETTFAIAASRHRAGARTLVPPDVAVCDNCLREMQDPTDRRFRHPFITCTDCGPRYTIITDLPYDRPATTMREFPMCRACAHEYDDPTDRRHHAQPIGCHDCGPRLWWEDAGEGAVDRPVIGDDAVIARAWSVLASGMIVGIKGVGGFHLACDAIDQAAVIRLRERKRRPDKPFAVMARDLDAARLIAEVSPAAEAALTQRARPIVLLPAREDSVLAEAVAPGLDEVGVMLPYAPLHHLVLSDDLPLLVMTSGNLSDEPLCFTNDDARGRLSGIVDGFVMHDRAIAVPCEDSVTTVLDGVEVPVRRSRGYAPLPVPLSVPGPVTLGVGAEVKNTFCLARGDLAFCSAHVGDMGSLESQAAFATAVDQLVRLRAAVPEVVVADLHPGYSSRRLAEDYAERHPGVQLREVQHHHAHVASLLADHQRVGTPIIGVAFDGTGYGCDRQVWGGEVLAVDADVTVFERVGHLATLSLPGGDAAVRNPFRVALGLLHGADLGEVPWRPEGVAPEELALVRSQLLAQVGCVQTSSIGRLFDGVAALLGVRQRVSYEAQAAIELEVLARRTSRRAIELPLPLEPAGDVVVLDWRPLVRELVGALDRGCDRGALALGFHHAITTATAELVLGVAARTGVAAAGLTGGVFANRILSTALAHGLRRAGLEVLTHHRIPCNDGGLSLGQVVVGRALVEKESTNRRANDARASGREEVS